MPALHVQARIFNIELKCGVPCCPKVRVACRLHLHNTHMPGTQIDGSVITFFLGLTASNQFPHGAVCTCKQHSYWVCCLPTIISIATSLVMHWYLSTKSACHETWGQDAAHARWYDPGLHGDMNQTLPACALCAHIQRRHCNSRIVRFLDDSATYRHARKSLLPTMMSWHVSDDAEWCHYASGL